MRFLLLGRHRETGEVRLVSPKTYPSRQEALDDLGDSLGTSDAMAGHDLFVVDLDIAVPVVFLQAPVAAAPEQTPSVDVTGGAPAFDALAEIVAVEDAAVEGPAVDWSVPTDGNDEPLADLLDAAADGWTAGTDAVTEEAQDDTADEEPAGVTAGAEEEREPDLAEALRRAATHMESQGIVEPPSVEAFASSVDVPVVAEGLPPEEAAAVAVEEPVSEPLVWPWESASADTGVETAETAVNEEVLAETEEPAAAPLDEQTPGETESQPEPEPEPASDPVEVPETPEAEEIELETGPLAIEDTGVRTTQAVFEPVGIDEPGLEDITLLTPASDDAFSARPVIIGEYAEAAGSDDENPFAVLESIVAGEAAPQPSDEEGEGDAASDGAEEAQPEPVEASDAVEGDPAVEPKVYEHGGTDIAAYACADCVYVSTCPKANQDGPATCGSFQWTSV